MDEPASSGGKRKAATAAEGGRFEKELRSMMYGYGDSSSPLPESVQLMEDLVTDYLQQVLQQAQCACEERQRAAKARVGTDVKVRERDLLFVLRKDPRRHRRVQELLEVYREKMLATQDKPDYVKEDD